MATEVSNTPTTSMTGNALMATRHPLFDPRAWNMKRPRTKQPARVKLDNRSQKKGYLC